MAKAGDTLEHPVTGERIIFRKTAKETGGELMQGRALNCPPLAPVPTSNFHLSAFVLQFRQPFTTIDRNQP